MNSEHGVSTAASTPIGVVLIDDYDIWRDGIRTMLEGTEFEVLGEAGSGKAALSVVGAVQPRIVLLDIRMGGLDGFETLRELKAQFPGVSVIMLTTYDNPAYMARVLAAGGSGYLLKGATRKELLGAMRSVAAGNTLLLHDDLLPGLRCISDEGHADLPVPLTPRELEILRLVATGLSNREIASQLFITEGTVKNHVVHIIAKLGVADRVQASVWAVHQGLLAEE